MKDQANLIKELAKTSNMKMMKREVERAEQIFEEMDACKKETLKVVGKEEASAIVDRTKGIESEWNATRKLADTWLTSCKHGETLKKVKWKQKIKKVHII